MISHGEDNWLNFMKPFYYVEVKLTLKVKKEFKKYNFSYFIFKKKPFINREKKWKEH